MSFLDTAKDAYDLAKKGLTIEFQEKVMELREQALELQEENLRLRTRVREMEEKLEVKDSLVFKSGMYFRTTSSGDDGPFCARCYDETGKLLRLQALHNPSSHETHWSRKCEEYYGREP